MAEETNTTKVESGDVKPLVSGSTSNPPAAPSSQNSSSGGNTKSASQSLVRVNSVLLLIS